MISAQNVIDHLGLKPLPMEGGFYRETYRLADPRPVADEAPSALATAIYYLLTPDTQSAWHRLPFDELWHFYLGDPVELLNIDPTGSLAAPVLGPNLLAGHAVQRLVPAGSWQAACLRLGGDFALLGTTMTPGFEFRHYEPGSAHDLARLYPAHAERIHSFLR